MIKNYLLLYCLLVSSSVTAQVGIGTTTPDPSTVLEISSSNKGILIPRASIAASNQDLDANAATIQPAGMLIFNTNTILTGAKSFCYWDGAEWKTIKENRTSSATISGSLLCNAATLYPNMYTSGVAYSGVLEIPYTGGDGGRYSAQTIGPVNGLTITLAANNLTDGNGGVLGAGKLIFAVSGTPTLSSPATTIFPITIAGQSCSVTVGNDLSVGEKVFYKGTVLASVGNNTLLSSLLNDLPILGGKIKIDAQLVTSANSNLVISFLPVFSNIATTPIKIWCSVLTNGERWSTSNYLLASNSYVKLDNGLGSGFGLNDILGSSTPRAAGTLDFNSYNELAWIDLVFDNKRYRISYMPTVDNKDTADPADNTRELFIAAERLY